MPISYEPKILIAYLAVSIVASFGWGLGAWIAGKLFR